MANVVITVSDLNDNTPSFDHSPYSAEVTEGSDSKGRTVVTVRATDDDSGVNKEIVYSIKSGNVGETFMINTTTVR